MIRVSHLNKTTRALLSDFSDDEIAEMTSESAYLEVADTLGVMKWQAIELRNALDNLTEAAFLATT